MSYEKLCALNDKIKSRSDELRKQLHSHEEALSKARGEMVVELFDKVQDLEQFRQIVAKKPCICKPNWNKCDSCRAKAAGGGA